MVEQGRAAVVYAARNQYLQGTAKCNQDSLRRCGIWQPCTDRDMQRLRRVSHATKPLHEQMHTMLDDTSQGTIKSGST